MSILAPVKSITSLPSDHDVILNLTEINKQQGWYVVNPTDWKMSKWEFPNSLPSALNEETRRSYVSWSPETQRLLYAKKSISPNGSIEVLKIKDKSLGSSNQYTLSPDGKTVAYTDGFTDKTFGIVEDVYLFDIASQRSRRITKLAPGSVYQLIWSPDSKALVFWHRDTKKTLKTLYQINFDGSNLQVLLDAKNDLPIRIFPSLSSNDEAMKWSPDGRYLALLIRAKTNNNFNFNSETIWVLDLKTKKLRELFPTPPKSPAGGIQDFAWSPDGQKIVFAAGYDGKCYRPLLLIGYPECTNFLYLVDVNGSKPTKVTKIPQGTATRLLWLKQKRQ
ncbi:TolB family protein [Microcoleus sp. FACHB-831]|uniref:TolB family protein n=1 Tax=Microcoleus sp. FACHB-831 TaxID=2692827 RepID=UPI001A7EEFD1|nr:PD40 domain-containing protein [Microcoleus sp. FACHB-831]